MLSVRDAVVDPELPDLLLHHELKRLPLVLRRSVRRHDLTEDHAFDLYIHVLIRDCISKNETAYAV